ncbi:MAG: helix-turn-helix domain-containing protein [Bryobacteraceae bacterium]|nr:helix-turn-helix domain-containing protein [Bryobacteraceae bacterium]
MPTTTLAEISDKTKISKFFLDAIENGEFSKLPGGIFDRSFIRQYAEAAGLDAEPILERYQQFHERREQMAAPAAPRQSRPASALRTLFAWATSGS